MQTQPCHLDLSACFRRPFCSRSIQQLLAGDRPNVSRRSAFATLRFAISECINTSALLLSLVCPNILVLLFASFFMIIFDVKSEGNKSDKLSKKVDNVVCFVLLLNVQLRLSKTSKKQLKWLLMLVESLRLQESDLGCERASHAVKTPCEHWSKLWSWALGTH